MAMSKSLLTKQDELEKDLTRCGICLCPIQNPKALPCLHAFCLNCILEWAKDETEKVKCPVCKDEFPLPKDGITGFKSNYYVVKLKETLAMKEEVLKKSIKCTFCEELHNDAIARCLDCKEYLCNGCVKAHKTYKTLKGHTVHRFDDITSGNVDIHTSVVEEYCSKHKGQVLWFYCETCGELICRDCTVVHHPAFTHKLVDVEDVSGDQRQKLKDLLESCEKVAHNVEKARGDVEDVEKDLNEALDNAKREVKQAKVLLENQFASMVKRQEQQLFDEIDKIGSEHKTQVNHDKDSLQTQTLQLQRALQMTNNVMEKGSPYDMAAMYTTLTSTLQRLSDIKPCRVDQSLAAVNLNVNKYVAVDLAEVIDGWKGSDASYTFQRDLSGTWMKESQKCEYAGLATAMKIAFNPSGDTAIASLKSAQINIFDSNWQIKRNIDTKQSSTKSAPRGVVISVDGNTYVTDRSSSVKVFDTSAKLINQFQTYPPGVSQTPFSNATLADLSMMYNNNLVVVNPAGKYISIHKQSGEHVFSFKVSIEPWFVKAAPSKDIIVVNNVNEGALIADSKGQVLHTITSIPISALSWKPTGAFFNGDNEFLIASHFDSGKSGGIYHFSNDGKFLSCITKDVENPTDVAITEDGNILVLEWTHVKVFKKN